jgi:deoxyguanosine kinase
MSDRTIGKSPPEGMRILAIEGPIGVGKTTLARRLAASYATQLMLEEPAENPFLEKYYEDQARYALPTQLQFLFQRVRQLQSFRQEDLFTPLHISDYMLDKDRLFAELTLESAELNMYSMVYERVVDSVPNPDLVIYLQATVPSLLKRIAHRGLVYEQGIDEAYLERLSSAYIDFFRSYSRAPLLIVDTEEINFSDGDAEYLELLETIDRGVSGTQYFAEGQLLW